MIWSFRDSKTGALFNDQDVPRFRSVERVARRKLLYLHRSRNLEDLRVPPGNRLEALKGDRKGQYSIRINDQWRICFVWKDGDAYDVEITDYH
jgi:toxin HigB-1